MSRHMRTTVRLDDALLDRAKRRGRPPGGDAHGSDRSAGCVSCSPIRRSGSGGAASRPPRLQGGRGYAPRRRSRRQRGPARHRRRPSLILPDVNVLLYAFRDDSARSRALPGLARRRRERRPGLRNVVPGALLRRPNRDPSADLRRTEPPRRRVGLRARVAGAAALHSRPARGAHSAASSRTVPQGRGERRSGEGRVRGSRGRVGMRVGHDGRRLRALRGPSLAPAACRYLTPAATKEAWRENWASTSS